MKIGELISYLVQIKGNNNLSNGQVKMTHLIIILNDVIHYNLNNRILQSYSKMQRKVSSHSNRPLLYLGVSFEMLLF